MADDVSIRLRLLDRLRFSREAALAQKSIDDVGDEAKQTNALMSTLNRTGGSVARTMGRGIKYAAIGAASAFAAAGAGAVNYASDLGESISKAGVIFGKHAAGVQKWSKGMAENFGVARGEALEAASGYMAMFKAGGLIPKQATEMSKSTAELAADMASMHNADPSEMLDKLRAGLSGEAEPLRRYGVFISEAAVQTEALRAGIAKEGEELTDAQKIQARYNIIMKQTADAQGDVARTADSLPNVLRKVKAVAKDTLAGIGTELLPGIASGLSQVSDNLVPALEGMGPILGDLVGSLSQVAGPLIRAGMPLLNSFGQIFGMIAKALAPVLEMLGPIMRKVMDALMPAIEPLVAVLGEGLLAVLEALGPSLPEIARAFADLAIAFVPLIKLVATFAAGLAKVGGPVIAMVVRGLASIVTAIEPVVRTVGNIIIGIVNLVIRGINLLIKGWNLIPGHTDIDEIPTMAHLTEAPGQLDPALTTYTPGKGSGGIGLMASGGTAMAHRPYFVGEEGVELFVPRVTGAVIPNDRLASAGGDGAGLNLGGGFTWHGDMYVQGGSDPEATAEAVIRKLQSKGARL